jgi:catechol 2,3-dioxygenase-like lactoylglutathione lyase family enzyme
MPIWDDPPMLHHVALEVRPADMDAEGEFWLAAGFEKVAAPRSLGEGYDWYEREGTQIHLMETAEPSKPPARGHVAVVAPQFDETLARLRAHGFEVTEGSRHWGARRVKSTTPAGHVVELMEFPPEAGGN